MTAPTRVLIIGPSNIGDAILAGDVIAAVRRNYPSAHLTLVVGERAHALFAGDPRIQTLVDADAFSSLTGRLKLAVALWRYQPQVVVDVRHTLYPLMLKPLTGWRYLLQPPARVVHMRDRHLWKLRMQAPSIGRMLTGQAPAAARDVARSESPLWISPKDEAHVDQLCRRWGVAGQQPLVVICPGARSHIKRWMSEGFAQVAQRLIRDAHAQVVLSGEPAEEEIIEEVLGLMDQPAHSAVGLTTIRQAAALMRRAALVITNDSASLHIASAVGTPTVAIFGPTRDDRYGPTAPQRRTIRRRLFCAPCGVSLCRFSHECMRFIGANEVYEAAQDLLSRNVTQHA